MRLRDDAMVGAEIDRQRKGTANDGEPLGEVFAHPGKEEIVMPRAQCVPLAPANSERAVEDDVRVPTVGLQGVEVLLRAMAALAAPPDAS